MDVTKTLEAFEKNDTWIGAHREHLRAHYPDQYVAVLDGKVVDADPDVQTLTERLKQIYGEREKEAAVRYISSKEFEMILIL